MQNGYKELLDDSRETDASYKNFRTTTRRYKITTKSKTTTQRRETTTKMQKQQHRDAIRLQRDRKTNIDRQENEY